jgi:uncharacterized membrane protein
MMVAIKALCRLCTGVIAVSARALFVWFGWLVVGTQQVLDALVVDGLPVVETLRAPGG